MLIRSYELLIEHRKKVIAIVVAIALTVVLLFLLSYENVRADSVMLYPQTCFGNWKNPELAAGNPVLTNDSPQEDFNETNSAMLADDSQLTCTGFAGEIPDGTVPNKLKVSLVWSVDNGEVDHKAKEVVPVTIDTLLNEEEKSLPAIDPVVIEKEEDAQARSATEEATEPVVELAPTAEESSEPSPEPEPETEPEPEPEPEAPSESEPTTFLFTKKAFAQETDVQADSAIEEVPESEPVAPSVETTDEEQVEEESEERPISKKQERDGFMEMFYSVDGDDWISLGVINRSDWKSVSFEIPITNWSDIDTMQVALKPVETYDKRPIIYIDTVSFEISYDSFADLMKQNDSSSDQKKLIIMKLLDTEGSVKITQRFDSDQGNILVFNSPQERSVIVASLTSSERVTFFIGQGEAYELPSYQLSAGDWQIISLPPGFSCDGLLAEQCATSPGAIIESSFTTISAFDKPIVIEDELGTAEVIPIQLETAPLEMDSSDIINNDVIELINEQYSEPVADTPTQSEPTPSEQVAAPAVTSEEMVP